MTAISIARFRSISITLVLDRVKPETISLIIWAGSSLRGLSLVKTAKSDPANSAAPINGRLLRSRSPPQPRTAITFPAVLLRRVSKTLVTESGECA